MKTKFAIAAALMLSLNAFAQKEELKALKKISDKEGMPSQQELQEFKTLLTTVEPKMANATDEQKAEYHYYKGQYGLVSMMMNPAAAGPSSLDAAIDDLNMVIELEKKGKKKYTKEIQEMIYPEMKAQLINMAGALGKQQQYKAAAPLYETAFKISPKDTLYLYNAAAYAVNAQDYDTALNYFERLDKLGFTGSGINYTAKNKATGQVEYYGDKKVRDLFISQQTHVEPGIYREPSKRNDIIKNIALIYIQKGDKEKAKRAIENAKKADPNDTSLILAEAQIYLEAKDYDSYKKAVTEVLNKGSKDPNLYFNLGVTTSKSGQVAEAEQYYKKAIELKPDFAAAYQNIAVLQLDGEDKIVNEMNSLGTTKKDQARYDELKKQRDEKYRKAMRYLEQGHKADPANADIKNMLGVIYQGLEMQKEYNALKAQK